MSQRCNGHLEAVPDAKLPGSLSSFQSGKVMVKLQVQKGALRNVYPTNPFVTNKVPRAYGFLFFQKDMLLMGMATCNGQ